MLREDICLGLLGFFIYASILPEELINFQSNSFPIIFNSREYLANRTILIFLLKFEKELVRRRSAIDWLFYIFCLFFFIKDRKMLFISCEITF